jgi:hypothetical protein
MNTWNALASEEILHKTVSSLKKNGIESLVVSSSAEAKEKVLAMIPKGAEVMTMSSVTLETAGLTKAINESGAYDAVKPKLFAMDRKTQGREMQKLGAAPDWAVGSVHAVTEDGHVLIASNTGSQLSGYVYGAGHVIWVVGTQKIVSSVEDGMKRIYEYVVPLEEKHMQSLYKISTNVSKLLIYNAEKVPGRVTIVFVKEQLGF